MNKEIDLSVSCYGKTRELVYDLVLLPWGATEPHNLHLPYLTDCILAHAIAVDAAERSKELYGVRCMVMPPGTAWLCHPSAWGHKIRDSASYPSVYMPGMRLRGQSLRISWLHSIHRAFAKW